MIPAAGQSFLVGRTQPVLKGFLLFNLILSLTTTLQGGKTVCFNHFRGGEIG